MKRHDVRFPSTLATLSAAGALCLTTVGTTHAAGPHLEPPTTTAAAPPYQGHRSVHVHERLLAATELSADAVEAAQWLLTDPAPAVRERAVRTLLDIGEHGRALVLRHALQPDAELSSIAEGWREVGCPPLPALLQVSRKHDDRAGLHALGETIRHCYPDADDELVRAALDGSLTTKTVVGLSPSPVSLRRHLQPLLEDAVNDPTGPLSPRVIELLEARPLPALVPALRELSQLHPSARTRAAILRVLALGEDAPQAALIASADPDPLVRTLLTPSPPATADVSVAHGE